MLWGLSKAWPIAKEFLNEAAEPTSAQFELRGDRVKGRLLLKVGKRIFPIVQVMVGEHSNKASVCQEVDFEGLPAWCPQHILNKIVSKVLEEDSFA